MGNIRKPGNPARQRIAVIGAGISGLASAWLLARDHAVTVFEAGHYAGGHTNTVDVTLNGVTHPVDTGFLVFNDRTYPNLIALFEQLGVRSQPSDMSFGVSLDGGRLEWAGSNLDTVFAQRKNLVSPRFLGMLRDILRFNRESARNLEVTRANGISLEQLLVQGGYGTAFRDDYLLPMAAAIWSSATDDILKFPAATFLQFCINHGLLQIENRPQWRSVMGGGREYVRKLCEALADLRLRTPVLEVVRSADSVKVRFRHGDEFFDAVVFATHAPTTLQLLSDGASAGERALLSAVRYQPNVALLHTDTSLLPKRQKVWSAWNYLGGASVNGHRPVCVSYLLNQLQPLPFTDPVIVTLNPISEPAPDKLLARFEYEHPLLDQNAVTAQTLLPQLQGENRTWFAGAWTGYGFHEDGLKSALRVAADFAAQPAWAQV
ncbi:NAD(P)/FAD-dependent oxidoreductase [Silvimonas sp.]|uniref:NAD(P)/FAD-dependent oxidoreductase n=1 Tax=Silvimonas sp. TaxID=2650811 RepID=UPI003867E986